ncbi:hypothetical protein GPALN_012095 [Globodera pallida]|nr:hypothetical protein GPALN_012095 [Globodera pallida]
MHLTGSCFTFNSTLPKQRLLSVAQINEQMMQRSTPRRLVGHVDYVRDLLEEVLALLGAEGTAHDDSHANGITNLNK